MADTHHSSEAGQVLPNLPGLTDTAELAVFERGAAGHRIAQLARDPSLVTGDFISPPPTNPPVHTAGRIPVGGAAANGRSEHRRHGADSLRP